MKPLSGRFLCNLLPLNQYLALVQPRGPTAETRRLSCTLNADLLIELHPRVKLVYRSLALPEK
jgi:hypothetical protein